MDTTKSFTLITGASSGIGEALAFEFASHRHNLILVARSLEKLEEVGLEIKKRFKVDIEIIQADLSNQKLVDEVCNKIDKNGWKVDCLVNNAGYGDWGEFHNSSWEKISGMIELNVHALTHTCWRMLPNMVKRGNGHVINIASVASFFPGPYMAVYFATKAFVLSFSEALSEELSGSGVYVTCLCPGPVATGFQQRAGFVHKKNAPTPEVVAKYAYIAAMKNKKVIAIPGLYNWVQSKMPHLLPRQVVRKIVKWVQTK